MGAALKLDKLTTSNPFKPAEREQIKVKLALVGTPGTGKTYTAMNIAKYWGGRVAFVDSERGSAKLYAKEFKFDHIEMVDHHPDSYTNLIKAAAHWGYETIIIDSLSHPWSGDGGIMEMVDKHSGKNKFDAWSKVNPIQSRLIDAILDADVNIIATLRGKPQSSEKDVEPIFNNLGIVPDQRNGVLHEFDVVGVMDASNTLHIAKSRANRVHNLDKIEKPGRDFAKKLKDWADEGSDPSSLFSNPDRLAKWIRSLHTQHASHLDYKVFAGHVLKYLNQSQGTQLEGLSGFAGVIEPEKAEVVILSGIKNEPQPETAEAGDSKSGADENASQNTNQAPEATTNWLDEMGVEKAKKVIIDKLLESGCGENAKEAWDNFSNFGVPNVKFKGASDLPGHFDSLNDVLSAIASYGKRLAAGNDKPEPVGELDEGEQVDLEVWIDNTFGMKLTEFVDKDAILRAGSYAKAQQEAMQQALDNGYEFHVDRVEYKTLGNKKSMVYHLPENAIPMMGDKPLTIVTFGGRTKLKALLGEEAYTVIGAEEWELGTIYDQSLILSLELDKGQIKVIDINLPEHDEILF